jgi:hypothetical protein
MARSRGAHGVPRRTKKQAAPEESSKKEIWSSMLEGRYTVTVHWLRPYRGKLTIWEGEKLIHSQKLALMYHAVFGPDVDDVATWQEIATTVVDGLKQPPEIPSKGRVAGGPVA